MEQHEYVEPEPYCCTCGETENSCECDEDDRDIEQDDICDECQEYEDHPNHTGEEE